MILSFGDGIQVIEPPTLREAIKEELAVTLKNYD